MNPVRENLPANSDGMDQEDDPDYELSEQDWISLQERGDFLDHHLSQARQMIETAIQEYLHHESDPYDIKKKKEILDKLKLKIHNLGDELYKLSFDDEIYGMLVDDNSPEIPATFSSGGNHPAHQELLNLMNSLRTMDDRIENVKATMPQTRQGPQNQNLVRLMLRANQLISQCTNRDGLSMIKERIIDNKYSARDLPAYMCRCAALVSSPIKDSHIDLAIENAQELSKGEIGKLQRALGPYSIYNVLFGDPLKDIG